MLRFLGYCVAALLLLTGFVHAADVDVAERALNRRMLRAAREGFQQVLSDSPKPDEEVRARIGLARTELLAGSPRLAMRILNELPPLGDPEWIGRANLVAADASVMLGDLERASALLEVMPELAGPWQIWKVRLQARILAQKGDAEAARTLLQDILKKNPDQQEAKAELASVLMLKEDTAEALTLWRELAGGDPADFSTQQAQLALARAAVEAEEWEEAGKLLTQIREQGGVFEELEMQAYPLFVRWLGEQGKPEEAVKNLLAMEKRATEPAERVNLRAYRVEALVQAGRLEEAETLLGELIATEGDHPLLARGQLVLARYQEDQGKPEKALEAYSTFLSVFTDPDDVLEATVGQARMQETLGRLQMAATTYGKAVSMIPPGDAEREPLMFKQAELAMKAGQFKEAEALYQKIIATHPQSERMPDAWFQAAVAHAKSDGGATLREAVRRLRELRLRHPAHPVAEKALYRIALLQEEAGQLEQALGSYTAYLSDYPKGTFAVDAVIDKGIVSYRIGFFQAAMAQFDLALERFPEHPRTEQARCLRSWTLYLLGQDAEAQRVALEFLSKYPQSTYAPEVRVWVAGMAFNRGAFEEAEQGFAALSKADVPVSKRIQASYLAGRASLARKQYAKALAHFDQAIALSADTEGSGLLAMESLFYRGDALTELNRFDEAIVTFDRFIATYPDSEWKYAALGRKGDCQFTLGDSNPERYLEALGSYQQVSESDVPSPDIQLQAQFKRARTLRALGRGDEALAVYQRVMDRYLSAQNRLGPEVDVWFVRSVTDAAQLLEAEQDYVEAVRVYQVLADTKLQGSAEARRRIEELKEQHSLLMYQGESP